MPIPTSFNSGSFIPTTGIYDVSDIYETDVQSREFKELIVRLYQNLNVMAKVLNIKESAYYVRNEFLTGALLYPNPNNISTPQGNNLRQIFRTTVDCGDLPASSGSPTITPHNITMNSGFSFIAIYGAATLPAAAPTMPATTSGDFIPLPYFSTVTLSNISIRADNTYVYISTQGQDYSSYTGIVVLEYVKS